MEHYLYLRVLAATKKVARQNKLYSKKAFEEWLDKAKKSDKANELIPDDLRVRMAPRVIDVVLDEFFCKAIKLEHCTPLPQTYLCQCNKVMMFWQDQTEVQCDRVSVGMIKPRDLKCNTALENEKCSFSRIVPCDSWPGIDDFPRSQSAGMADNFFQQSSSDETTQAEAKLPKFQSMKQEAAKDKPTNVESASSEKPSSVGLAGQTHQCDGGSNSDCHEEDL